MARVCFKTSQTTTTTTKGTKGLAGSSTCCPAWGSESNPWNTQKARGPDAVMNICKPSAPVAERGRDRGNAWKLQGQAAWNPKGHNGNRQTNERTSHPHMYAVVHTHHTHRMVHTHHTQWCAQITLTEWCTHSTHTECCTHITHTECCTHITHTMVHTQHTHRMVHTHHTHNGAHTSHTQWCIHITHIQWCTHITHNGADISHTQNNVIVFEGMAVITTIPKQENTSRPLDKHI